VQRNQTGFGTPTASVQRKPALFPRSSSGLSVQLTAYPNLMLNLGISAATSPVLLTPARDARHIYFDFTSFSPSVGYDLRMASEKHLFPE